MGKFGVLGEYIEALFNEHKFVRRMGVMLCWGMDIAILLASIVATFKKVEVSDNVQMVWVTLIGLNHIYTALYQWDRSRESG